MRMALMQPYFFPYPGHFELIGQVDLWVVFDTAQYIRRGWMNRNRIMKPGGGWQYVNVPVQRFSQNALTKEMALVPGQEWKTKLVRQLEAYRGLAPNFDNTLELVKSCLDVDEEDRLSPLNVKILSKICAALDIPFEPVFLSETTADPGPCASPGERVLQIAAAMGASTYLNPAGGAHLLDNDAFTTNGIRLEIQSFDPLIYESGPLSFISNLSVLDALMWVSWEKLSNQLVKKGF